MYIFIDENDDGEDGDRCFLYHRHHPHQKCEYHAANEGPLSGTLSKVKPVIEVYTLLHHPSRDQWQSINHWSANEMRRTRTRAEVSLYFSVSVHSLGWGRWRWWWAMMICIIAIIILKKCDTNLLNVASSFTRPMAVHWSGLNQSSANEMLRSRTQSELTLYFYVSLSLSLSLSLSVERVFKQRRDRCFSESLPKGDSDWKESYPVNHR